MTTYVATFSETLSDLFGIQFKPENKTIPLKMYYTIRSKKNFGIHDILKDMNPLLFFKYLKKNTNNRMKISFFFCCRFHKIISEMTKISDPNDDKTRKSIVGRRKLVKFVIHKCSGKIKPKWKLNRKIMKDSIRNIQINI